MKIEDLKAEWDRIKNFCGHPEDRDRPENFAFSYMDKLLAVVEAALKEREAQNKIGQTVLVELHDALDDLLEEK